MSELYPHLFSPITFRGMTVKNRIFLPPMKTNYVNPDPTLSDQIIDYYVEMAKGGIGLITTEAAEIDKDHLYDPTILNVFDDNCIPGFKKLADALHEYDCKLSVQLIQGGPFANSAWNGGRMPLSSTPIAHVWNPMETPIEMTHDDIKHYVQLYCDAALRAKKAGCDAIEIHASHAHALLGSFLSAVVNHRTDEYGGTIMGRGRFLFEVCTAVRKAVGEEFPISVRLSATDAEEGGTNEEDNVFLVRELEKIGVDYIHFSNGSLYDVGTLLPPTGKFRALNTKYTDVIRKYTNMKFGVVGRIKEPWVADLLIEQNKMDMVYIGRQMIADPEFPNKCREGRFEEVRYCIGCLRCLESSAEGIRMECSMNPGVKDYHLNRIAPADVKKNVVVIGAGPAGMEAALTLKKRGHNVTLVEASDHMGGQFIIASYPPVKQELSSGLKWYIGEVKRAGIKVLMNTKADKACIEALNPDEIVVATGAKCSMPRFLTESGHPNVVSAWDVLAGKVHPGLNCVVIGGGSVGCEVAEFISPRHDYRAVGGRKITVIEMLPNLDMKDATANRDYLMARIKTKPIDIHCSSKVTAIGPDYVSYEDEDGTHTIKGVDTIISAMGSVSVNELAEELKPLGKPITVIGDAKEIGRIVTATASGRENAIHI